MDFDVVRVALRREREARVGSRAKLAKRSGVTEGTIYKIEQGWIDPRTKHPYVPSADAMLRLISALPGLAPSQFFNAIDQAPIGTAPSEPDRLDALAERIVSAMDRRVVDTLTTPAVSSEDQALIAEVTAAIPRLGPSRKAMLRQSIRRWLQRPADTARTRQAKPRRRARAGKSQTAVS